MRRRTAAGLILVAWVLALGWHARAEHFRGEDERLARGVALLAPGVAYYAVHAGGAPMGWARTTVDTVPGRRGLRLDSQLEIPGGRGPVPAVSVRSGSRLDSLLRLRSFSLRASGLPGAMRVEGRVRGDTGLVAVVRSEGRAPDTLRIPLDGPLVPPAALPLRLAASGRLRQGLSVAVALLDPVNLRPATVRLRVAGRATRVFVDSAAREGRGQAWRAARRDTVEAWELRHEAGPFTVRSWIGPDGRLVEARVGETLRVERTAFELAFYPVSGRSP